MHNLRYLLFFAVEVFANESIYMEFKSAIDGGKFNEIAFAPRLSLFKSIMREII